MLLKSCMNRCTGLFVIFLLQSWHVSWLTPHLLYFLKLVFLLWVKSFPIVLSTLKDIFRSKFSNSVVMNFVCRPTYVNLVLFFSLCVFVSVVRLILFKIFTSYLLLFNIFFIVSYSFLLFVSLIEYVKRRLTKYLIATSFLIRIEGILRSNSLSLTLTLFSRKQVSQLLTHNTEPDLHSITEYL